VKHFKIIFLFVAGEKIKIANCVEVFAKKNKGFCFFIIIQKTAEKVQNNDDKQDKTVKIKQNVINRNGYENCF
jgi:hypothetical protein